MVLAALLQPLPRGRFLLALGVIGGFCLLHLLNDLRLGPIRLSYDLAYMAKVAAMPIQCLCLIRLIRTEETARQAFRGLGWAAGLTGLFLLLAFLTGTGNSTYGPGLGFSGWVIDSNRCAGSILLVTLSVFTAARAVESKSPFISVGVLSLIAVTLLVNGTKACYYGLFAVFAAYVGYLVMEALWKKSRPRLLPLTVLLLWIAAAALLYPYTPRYRVDQALARAGRSGETEAALAAQGIDLEAMNPEERYQNPAVRAALGDAYRRYMSAMPDLIDRFGIDRVLRHYRMTTDVRRLVDSREIERSYARMIWEDSDLLTRLVGFEASQMGFDGLYDLENDGHALFYYYGCLGFVLYLGFLFSFVLRILRRVRKNFRDSFTLENFSLLLSLGLQLGLAQFSGALLRRPNVSVYLALVLALIRYQTRERRENP